MIIVVGKDHDRGAPEVRIMREDEHAERTERLLRECGYTITEMFHVLDKDALDLPKATMVGA